MDSKTSPSPFDDAFGAAPDVPVQPEHTTAGEGTPVQTYTGMQAEMPTVVTPVPEMTAPGIPVQPMQQYLLTPNDEEDMFGRERISLTGKILIAGGVIAVLLSVVAGGLWLYTTVYQGSSTQTSPNSSVAVPPVNKNAPLDSDNDGLTDVLEKKYGSDPKKKDTDGDGYSDGEEVKNGYNPNGPGKLTIK